MVAKNEDRQMTESQIQRALRAAKRDAEGKKAQGVIDAAAFARLTKRLWNGGQTEMIPRPLKCGTCGARHLYTLDDPECPR